MRAVCIFSARLQRLLAMFVSPPRAVEDAVSFMVFTALPGVSCLQKLLCAGEEEKKKKKGTASVAVAQLGCLRGGESLPFSTENIGVRWQLSDLGFVCSLPRYCFPNLGRWESGRICRLPWQQ